MQLLFKRRLPGKKYIRLKAAGAGEMNKSEFPPLALRDLQQRQGNSFSPRGQISRSIYGFVGINGAGKTMLFRALSGLIRIDSGQIRWNNQILHKNIEVLPSLGIVIENAGLYPNLTGFDNLKELADLRRSITSDDIRFAMNRVGLDPADSRLYKKYSLGMKQRLIIAQAIMERPDVIMLDEPTNALDEESAANVRTIIREERERGAIVLLASHNREDIYPLADVIYHINDGRIDKIEMVKE